MQHMKCNEKIHMEFICFNNRDILPVIKGAVYSVPLSALCTAFHRFIHMNVKLKSMKGLVFFENLINAVGTY